MREKIDGLEEMGWSKETLLFLYYDVFLVVKGSFKDQILTNHKTHKETRTSCTLSVAVC